MKIRLNEIPEDGREYIINRQSSEFNETLKDLIEKAPYEVQLYLKPINSKDFEMTGDIKTHSTEQCSRCADDFQFSIQKKVKEILIPEPQPDRTGKYAKSTLSLNNEDEALSVSHYKSSQFDLAEFVHEAVALEIPFNPICSTCLKQGELKPFIYDEKMGEETKPNPFQTLKGLKLN